MVWKSLMLLCALGTAAGAFPAIPPEVWAIKESNGAPACGAVIVEEKAAYGVRSNTFDLRIRIYNEAGKAAANLPPFSSDTHSVTCRTVLPDGREIPADKLQDFAHQVVASNSYEGKRSVVIPPGLTPDCVVDLHWVVDGCYFATENFKRGLLRPFPIRSLRITFPREFNQQPLVFGGKTLHLDTGKDGGSTYFQFTDLPAWEDAPYTVKSLEGWPSLFGFTAWVQAQDGKQDMETAWTTLAKEFVRPRFEGFSRGLYYRSLLRELQKDLPADPLLRTQELLARVEKRIRNLSRLTYEERAKHNEHLLYASSDDLDGIASEGCANARGVRHLLYQVLKDSQVKPVLLYVVDRNENLFRPKVPTLSQFDDIILGVKTADGKGYGWFEAGSRYSPPGVIASQYQGTQGLLVDPEGWSVQVYSVPIQPARLNVLSYTYELKVEDEADRFKVRARFSGLPEYRERCDYLPWDPAEQGRLLKKTFEERSKSYAVTRAEVLNATDPVKNLICEVEGTSTSEALATREVDPFPGMPSPLWVPEVWPAERTKAIILDHCLIQTATSRIDLPKGWRLKAPPRLKEENAWGSVLWEARTLQTPEGERVEVVFKVEADRMAGTAQDYLTFRTFLGWIKKGCCQGLVLVEEAGHGE